VHGVLFPSCGRFFLAFGISLLRRNNVYIGYGVMDYCLCGVTGAFEE